MGGGICCGFVSSRICVGVMQLNRRSTCGPLSQLNLFPHSWPLRISLLRISCRSKSWANPGDGDGGSPKNRTSDQEAILKAISEVSKADNRISKKTFMVMGGTTPESSETKWRLLGEKVNLYPMVSRFTVIGVGGDDFVHSMVFAVESVLESPIPKAWVTKRLSSRGKYVSVKIGPVFVNSSEQAHAVYDAMKRDVRMKYFL
ncbi:hypothetical protein O6H91_06G057700 [Diphasiastrum complanatum]|uniref:Uncharacterized protein n=2 Tax=Diphasiastrum complanatum TaxID=34168 RepID=A0ACC2DDT4_DIPCM|nr:hypothetical protein O6H91_06G057700 [Diphasiastrum complanatum]KAJ7552494.1 hypothetical protein O6H91_06G057700 [Diphasiastrum complanatum]